MGNSLSGGTLSFIAQVFPPAPKWTTKNMPDLTGKVTIVTGGNTGIGKETVKVSSIVSVICAVCNNLIAVCSQALLEHNAKVYMAARSKERAEAAIQDLKQTTGREAIFLPLDLSNLASVRESAAEFSRQVYVVSQLYIELT